MNVVICYFLTYIFFVSVQQTLWFKEPFHELFGVKCFPKYLAKIAAQMYPLLLNIQGKTWFLAFFLMFLMCFVVA